MLGTATRQACSARCQNRPRCCLEVGLRGISVSLAAQKGARAKAETKVTHWETKLVELRRIGDEERITMAEYSLGKAKKKVEEKEEAIEALDRSVWRIETIAAAEVDKVKEEEVDEVVEVEVEVEEMVEETVKEEVEAKVVVETAVGGGGGWLRFFGGSRDAGVIQDLPWDPAVVAGPHPPNLDHPLLVPPESPVWTLRFLMQRVHQRLLGSGRWVWVDEGRVVHLDKPMRVGVVRGWWGRERELPRRKWGETPPPPEKGVKMFELAQFKLFTPEKKKGGGTHRRFIGNCWQAWGLGGIEFAGRTWNWKPNLVGVDGHGGVRPGGGQPGGICRVGARHRLPAQVQAQARHNPRNWPPPAAAPPQPP